ncbi:phosphotransferase family protein [Streptomyces sp. NPDC059166]|uniref:phosphotransferase family protein n=1 Tax=Streptomyces sp. NPDC059166 TaxID=3346752 RepID=UPI0036794DB0
MSVDATAAVLTSLGVRESEVVSREPLTGGTYNTVTRVILDKGRDWVVKVPPGHPTGLSYERRLLVNEFTFYRAAAEVGGGVIPRVVRSALSPDGPAGMHLVMTTCPGRPWSTMTEELQASDSRALRTEFGGIVGLLHGVTGPAGFGYPSEALGPLAPTWRAAFTSMTEAVLADALAFAARLPRPVEAIRSVLAGASDVLDEVTRPALVHFDLWQGNVLVTGEPGALRVGGVIDGERMFWGDPVADLVSTSLFEDPETDADFLAGYAASAAEPLVFSPSVRRRLDLYRSYLYLIMLTETVPRGPDLEVLDLTWKEVAPRLEAALDRLS